MEYFRHMFETYIQPVLDTGIHEGAFAVGALLIFLIILDILLSSHKGE